MPEHISLQQFAYDYLKDIIISGQLDENKIYSERQFSQKLNISRAPMRDAIQRLSQEEYVDILPKRGFAIHSLTKTDIVAMYQMRTAIESFCLHQYAAAPEQASTCEFLEKLEEINERQKQYLLPCEDYSAYIDLDCEFHQLIVSAIGNTWFIEAFQKYARQFRTMTKMTLTEPERIRNSVKEHSEICRIIREGDVAQINPWLEHHISSPTKVSLDLISQSLNL